LGPLAALTSALPVIRLDPGPGETVDLPALRSYSGPVGITLGKSGGLQGSMMTSALTLQLHLPDPEARRRYWLAAQVPMDNAVLEEVSARFLLTGASFTRWRTGTYLRGSMAVRSPSRMCIRADA
jgi:hypothetical protein